MWAGGAGASPSACLHIDSLSFDDAIVLLTVFKMLRLGFKCIARLCFYSAFFIIQPWFYPVVPPKVLLLCRGWGACMPRRSQRLCQLEFWLLVGTTMLDRLWAKGQTKCNTPLMVATSVFGRILRRPCYVMAQPKSRLDIPWPNDAECMGHVWYHFSCWYPLLFDVESLSGCVGG